MKKIYLLSLLFSILPFSALSASNLPNDLNGFKFDESKMDIGKMYHYVASTIKGVNSINIYVYVKSADTIVIYRAYNELVKNLVLLQTVHFNWKYMMAQELNAINPLHPDRISYIGISSKVNFNKKIITTKETYSKEDIFLARYKYEPCYNYEDYHIDLQFALRFLKNPTGELKVQNYMSSRINEAQLHYVGDEKVNDILCRKYELRNLGILAKLFNSKAYIWLAKDDPTHFCMKYVNYVQRDALWKDFKLEMAEPMKSMSPEEWENFTKKMISTANLLNF